MSGDRAGAGPRGWIVAAALVTAAACGGKEKTAPDPAAQGAVLEQADVATAEMGQISAGPAVSGSLQAATEAVLRAELAGTIASAAAEEGERVRAGTLLARIADPRLSEQTRSAESAVRSAEIAANNARRDVDRYETLVSAGASPRRDLESARTSLASAQAQLANARSQQADVRATVGDATVESPITGIVSSRSVSDGDVVQVGTELYRVVDPSTMRLEASVPSEQLYSIRVGAQVVFQVRGYPGRTFTGKVERINPTADPATRQVTIHVSLPNPGNALVAGLFAEGRVTAEARQGILVPADAVATEEGKSHVMRLRGGVVEQVPVQVGIQDEETRRVEIVSGLAAGDQVLVGPARETAPGTKVRVGTAVAAPARK
ncbi:efflux RND transporter periplasmic adaptor subunit [Longimicrobium terrae]|uniref:RND family efflux transporter MFP subunit n=1 Tax=Longimicrobium terrae TaxID=1639882 RepID=A0A841H527_9BACT|nr:efflux RND transporter periplasmic adaptor subunit [Longimicrobium terrae]MBB4639002.1 RND family efflux transporter MFP subunit [Longimicrobium terrae]MBB6073241.1 RND family efflux transporter MFP subunit [Longimicrobium terrae]NNC32308.1 efflux RND transporter periplasmic adaptor subunit [Longimicrobium terrae]